MDIFSDILPPLPTSVPISTVVEQVASTIIKSPSHHPAVRMSSRVPSTSRLGLPPPRQNPWARSGRTLLNTAMTDPAEAMRQAGLDWEVSRVDLRTADSLDPVLDFSAIRRSDNGRILGVVGRDYVPYSNQLMFDVFTDLAKVGKDDGGLMFTIETAGCFQGGKVVWALAHFPDLGIRIGDDESETYLLVSSGHTGNRPLLLGPTTKRPICQNTLRLAESQIRNNRKLGMAPGFTYKHLAGIHSSVNEAKEAFATMARNHAATKAAWNRLADVPLNRKLEAEYTAMVFGTPGPDEADRAKALRKTREERIASILASPTSQVKGTKDSLLAALFACTEWADHDRATRTSDGGDADEARLLSATFGSGAEVKERAWSAALELAA